MKPIDWSTEKDFPRLKAAVYHHLTGLGTKSSIDVIPDRTLTRHANNFRDIMHEKKIAFEDISSAMIFRNKLQRQKILSDSDIQFLQDIAVARDEANNGVTLSLTITSYLNTSN